MSIKQSQPSAPPIKRAVFLCASKANAASMPTKKRALELLAHKLAEHQTAQNADYAKQQHSGLYQVERGNPKRVFEGLGFRERYA